MTATATAYGVAESAAKPITRLSVGADNLQPHKAIARIVISSELLRAAPAAAQELISRELANAVTITTDALLFDSTDGLIAGVTPVASSGTGAAAVWTDIGALLRALQLSATSSPFIVVNRGIAAVLAITHIDGLPAFVSMSPQGGEIAGVPVIVSGGLPAGYVVAGDAAQIGLADEGIEFNRARHGSIELSDTPSAPSDEGGEEEATTTLTSLWQTDSVGLRCERFVSWVKLGPRAVSAISGAFYD